MNATRRICSSRFLNVTVLAILVIVAPCATPTSRSADPEPQMLLVPADEKNLTEKQRTELDRIKESPTTKQLVVVKLAHDMP